MKRLIRLPAIFFTCLLISCDSNKSKAPPHFDYVAEELAFARPTVKSLDALPGNWPLSESVRRELNWRRAFFARDFVLLDKAINDAHERYTEGQKDDDVGGSFISSIADSQLAGIDACKDWLAAMPRSYAAHWVCGAMWNRGAWIARSGEAADKVTPIRFALMRERFLRSSSLLEKARLLSPKPVEALTILGANRFMLGEKESASASWRQAQTIMPAYSPLHETRINFALPEWGGSKEGVAKAIEDARRAGVDENKLIYFHDQFVAAPWKLSEPGAEKIYWERAIAEQPTYFRLYSLAKYFDRVNNWRDGLVAASRLIEKYPDTADAYWMRGFANEKLGNMAEAWTDYQMAAAQGHDYATQALIRAHIQGGLGLAAKNWTAVDQVCRYGAALGSSAAANCMGSMFWEGGNVGEPFRTDIAQAFAWHLFAARAGYHNSQYDLGWLLMTGRAPGVKQEQAMSNGLFWLRRAAELDHQFAKKKLQEGGYNESEVVTKEGDIFTRILEIVGPILRYIL
jgi:tetratricopeptide (TPR) repeat protein